MPLDLVLGFIYRFAYLLDCLVMCFVGARGILFEGQRLCARDAANLYDRLFGDAEGTATEVRCSAHARRSFYDATLRDSAAARSELQR
jgi:hypothetical protein